MYEEYVSMRFLFLLPFPVAVFLAGAALADCLDGVLAMVANDGMRCWRWCVCVLFCCVENEGAL